MVTLLILIESEHTINILKNSLSKAFNGDFTELVTINQLARDLEKVNLFLGAEETVLSQNFDDIRTISSMRHYLTVDKVWVEITVPITFKQIYKLTNIITLPIVLGNNTIIFEPLNTQFLVNEQTTEYIPISDNEVEKCRLSANKQLICMPKMNTFERNEEICESGILFGGEINNLLNYPP